MASYDSTRAISRYLTVLVIVAGVDLLSKGLASVVLANGPVPIVGPLDFALVHNRGSAFGISLGAYTLQLNALATLMALGLSTIAVQALASVDRRAPMALGLIAGAAIGNLTSLLVPPIGVADFLSMQLAGDTRLVLNLADIAAYAGLVMTGRSVLLLARAIGAQRTRSVRRAPEIEVPIPLAVEGLADVAPSLPRGRETDRSISAPDRPRPSTPAP